MRQKIQRYFDNQFNFCNKATSKKCESIVIEMVINCVELSVEKTEKNFNMIEWRIIANKN